MKANHIKNQFFVAILAVAVTFFASCRKDDPEPELPQEEFASVVFNFIELEAHGDHYHQTTDTVKVTFGPDGNSTGSHYHLHAGEVYRLKVVAFDFAGREMQHEFLEDADDHQLFITGAEAGVLKYTYEDDRVGVTGLMEVLKPSDGTMILTAVLRHGLDKSRTTAADWDNPSHATFGGTVDFTLKFPLHVVEDDHDHH